MPTSQIRSKKAVTIISNNFSLGGTLACVTMARALAAEYNVQLIGCAFGESLWPGLNELEFEFELYQGTQFPGYMAVMRRMLSQIRGDVVIAHQLRLPSFGLGLLYKLQARKPCIVYIDDDDLVLTLPGRAALLHKRLATPTGDLYTRLMYQFRGFADKVICGSQVFSERFNGVSIPLGRDATAFDPDQYSKHRIRAQLHLCKQEFIIGFIGNPRPHTGFEDLLAALDLVRDFRIGLLVAPAGDVSHETRSLLADAQANVRLLEHQPSSSVPALLAASDCVVLPQRMESIAEGQLPARLVDAMAMAKPVISTPVSDAPKLLKDCGIIVPERSPRDIATALNWLRTHPHEAAQLGQLARERFLAKFSLSSMRQKFSAEIEQLLEER